ncbi:MAG: hypothetical protein AB1757_12685 [Acidobacteriota bacterium]
MSQQNQIQDRAESLADLPLTAEHVGEINAGGSRLLEGQLCGEGKQVVIAL